jgi:putative modified peptide
MYPATTYKGFAMTSGTDENTSEVHPPLPHAIADRLLDLLGSDDEFRDLFIQDTEAALLRLGLDTDAVKAALAGKSCLKVKSLASKEELVDARDRLREHLVGVGPHTIVFCFEAGDAGALKRKP